MNILILGATGFIGSALAQHLADEGHTVTGLGRAPARMTQRLPNIRWIAVDLATMTDPASWNGMLSGQDIVINCAGALQDGMADDLDSTQFRAMIALYAAAKSAAVQRIVQISARTDGAAANTPFLATKRRADEALSASDVPFVILRPALVIGRNAHGGTALLRALAAFPLLQPLSLARSRIATTAIPDVAQATSRAVNGELPSGTDAQVAAKEQTTLADLVRLHRRWLGLPPARIISVPALLGRPLTWLADAAGRLGWRSPLRSTAMTVMAEGVIAGERGVVVAGTSAEQTLAGNPAGVQDLWFARLYLLKPLVIIGLSLFWLLSGLIPLLAPARAAGHFLPFMSPAAAYALTFATCLLDIALGFTVLVRPWARKALFGMLTVSLAYLGGATLLEPVLWLDPIGPLIKVLPSMLLTLIALAILDER